MLPVVRCGVVTMRVINLDPVTVHGDTKDGMHVDYLDGWECHCEHHEDEVTATARMGAGRRRRLEGEDEEEKACWIGYEPLPTCAEMNIGHCDGNMTCAELCESFEYLPAPEGHEDHRFLEGEDEEHLCYVGGHHEDHRRLAEDDEEHGEEEYTMCFCHSHEAGEGIMVCADEGWECPEGDDCEEHSDPAASIFLTASAMISSLALAALSF
jgi:hypothetical protein